MCRFNLGYPQEQETGSSFLCGEEEGEWLFVGLGFSRRTEEGAY